MDNKILANKCLDQAAAVIAHVSETDYTLPTPDTEWTVHDLINHMLYELSWVPDMLAGKTIQAVGRRYDGDLIGNDLHGHWQAVEQRARTAIKDVSLDRTVHLSYGNYPASHYVHEFANDICIHSWDLGVAIGKPPTFKAEVADELYTAALPHKDSLASSGLFAPPVTVADSSNTQAKLLALYGRNPVWNPDQQ